MFETLKRLFSSATRRGLAAEARGELEEAAEHFSRAGKPALVFRARWARALRQADEAARQRLCDEALEAARIAGVAAETLREPSLQLAHGLLEDPEAGRERRARALELLVAAGEIEAAAELHLEADDFAAARALLERHRRYERLEAVDRAEAERRAREGREAAAIAEAQAAERQGRRREAEEHWLALERSSETEAALRERARQERQSLQASRLSGRARLRAEDGRVVILVAGLPAVLGRGEESPLPLADPGVSRRHARILRDGEALCLEDLGSRNGTLVDGVPLANRLVLGSSGRFELGDAVRLRWESGPPASLELERGLAAGTRCFFLREGEAVTLGQLFPGGAAAVLSDSEQQLRLERGRFLLRGSGLRLGTEPVSGPEPVELADGDALAWPGLRLEVSRG